MLMINRQCCSPLRMRNQISRYDWQAAGLLIAILLPSLGGAPIARADVPDWLRAAAQQPLPAYPKNTVAVQLLHEEITTVKDNSDIETRFRVVYKILRPEGRDYAQRIIPFDNETRITSLKGWTLPAEGKEYEVKDKESIETTLYSESFILFSDERQKQLDLPAADPGNIVAFEYVQKKRPFILQDAWVFQKLVPVRMARYILQLPSGWAMRSHWTNYKEQKPSENGKNQFAWELDDVPAIIEESGMPPLDALQGRMYVNFFPRDNNQSASTIETWQALGRWQANLNASSRGATPDLQKEVAQLTAGQPTVLDKMRALTNFMQNEIRYVAISIGIGGFQPHPAGDVFRNRYGDCKDKAILLSTMLHEIGVESYFLLINVERGVVPQEFPTLSFNHAILAIQFPEGAEDGSLHAIVNHPQLGRLLLFDPTDSYTPLGYLPPYEQASVALLVTPNGGDLIQTPLLAPATNRLMRIGKMSLAPSGALFGDVQEVRWGDPAVHERAKLMHASAAERRKFFEDFLGVSLPGFVLSDASIGNLDKIDDTLTMHYKFTVENYAKSAGNLLVLRPRVLGEMAEAVPEFKERKYPLEFDEATLQSDSFEITLPPGYVADDLPSPVHAVTDFAEYKSQVEVSGNVLKYSRTYEIKNVFVPVQKLDELRNFFHQVATDERSSAVLRKAN